MKVMGKYKSWKRRFIKNVFLSENNRSCLSEVFLGKGVLKICSKFTGEHPCRSVISIKLFALRHGFSPVFLLHISRAPFYKNTSGGLLICLWNNMLVKVKIHLSSFDVHIWGQIIFFDFLLCFSDNFSVLIKTVRNPPALTINCYSRPITNDDMAWEIFPKMIIFCQNP